MLTCRVFLSINLLTAMCLLTLLENVIHQQPSLSLHVLALSSSGRVYIISVLAKLHYPYSHLPRTIEHKQRTLQRWKRKEGQQQGEVEEERGKHSSFFQLLQQSTLQLSFLLYPKRPPLYIRVFISKALFHSPPPLYQKVPLASENLPLHQETLPQKPLLHNKVTSFTPLILFTPVAPHTPVALPSNQVPKSHQKPLFILEGHNLHLELENILSTAGTAVAPGLVYSKWQGVGCGGVEKVRIKVDFRCSVLSFLATLNHL